MSGEPVELYRKHRPTKLSGLLGQEDVVRSLVDLGRRKAFPHCSLMSGPSGTGKTTTTRILRRLLRCTDADLCEVNAAKERGIDTVRGIEQTMWLAPLGGECRVWVIDEAHAMTPDAQKALLKMLEDTPSHCYFMLATTNPQKIDRTIRTRATEFRFKLLDRATMRRLLDGVLEKEGVVVSGDVLDKIVDGAEGSPRKALVLLGQVVGLADEDDQLAAVAVGDASPEAVELARLLADPRTRWPAVARLLKNLDEEPESLRRMVLGYFTQVLLGGGAADRAMAVVEAFREDFYASGRAGLLAACYEVVAGVEL